MLEGRDVALMEEYPLDEMKPEVAKFRLVLDLEVVRGRRWRELAPFREAVLFHFTPQTLREQIVVLSEALADRILEEATEAPTFGEPSSRDHLRAVMADLEHDGSSLREFVAAYSEEMVAPNDREVLRLSLRLAEALERALADLNLLIGPAPSENAAEPKPEPQDPTERKKESNERTATQFEELKTKGRRKYRPKPT